MKLKDYLYMRKNANRYIFEVNIPNSIGALEFPRFECFSSKGYKKTKKEAIEFAKKSLSTYKEVYVELIWFGFMVEGYEGIIWSSYKRRKSK